MAEIVISEFMEQAAVGELAAGSDVLYDPTLTTLFEREAELCAALAPARALIVHAYTRLARKSEVGNR